MGTSSATTIRVQTANTSSSTTTHLLSIFSSPRPFRALTQREALQSTPLPGPRRTALFPQDAPAPALYPWTTRSHARYQLQIPTPALSLWPYYRTPFPTRVRLLSPLLSVTFTSYAPRAYTQASGQDLHRLNQYPRHEYAGENERWWGEMGQ